VRITHPFHPLAGQELEFVKRRKSWGADHVFFYDSAGQLLSLPAEWTDLVPPDLFVVVSAGRSPFHIDDLLALCELLAAKRAGDSSRVKRIMP
jgi:hypothetical protein